MMIVFYSFDNETFLITSVKIYFELFIIFLCLLAACFLNLVENIQMLFVGTLVLQKKLIK